MRSAARRLVMIGLDAAELAVVETIRASLPTIDRLLGGGVHRLASTASTLPGSVWPTFSTGTLPGVHGIYHHLQWDPTRMRIRRVGPEWLPYEPFWYGLERRGLEVAVLDVPMTFPPRRAAGIEIVNWGSHDQLSGFAAHPAAIGAEVRRRFGARHPMGYEIPVTKTDRELARIRRNLVDGARRKGELARWLYDLRDWDCFLVVFGETHRGGHILSPEGDGDARGLAPLHDVYRAVDAGLAPLVDAAIARGAAIVVFALHGMGPNTSQEHFVPRIMDRVNARFANGVDRGEERPLGDVSLDPAHRARTAAATQTRADDGRGVVRWLREHVPARLQNAVAQAVPVAVRDAVVDRQITGGHDWTHTPGLDVLADLNGYIRFNVRGREARGLLDPDGAGVRVYRDWLTACLMSLQTSDGAALVGDVVAAPTVFPGARSRLLPDLVVRWSGAPPATRVTSPLLGEITAQLATGRGGNHRFEGFCAIVAPPTTDVPPPLTHIAQLAGFAAAILGVDPARP